ncbi:hypothetical protein [Hydrogenophaga sp.]
MGVSQNRTELGRRMLIAGPRVAETVELFHRWVPDASKEVQGILFRPVMENDRLVAVEGALGRFDVVQEFERAGDSLFAKIVFIESPTRLRKNPREIYCIRIFEETAHFGPGPEPDHFDWDHDRNRWMSRNWLRIGYEIAVAATEPRT